jgi:hypothetical protein
MAMPELAEHRRPAGPGQPAAQPSWEDVLASFEATAEQGESLLHKDGDHEAALALMAAGIDPWQAALPALPADLRDRAEAVHRRQLLLADDLRTAMVSIKRQEQLTTDGAASSRGSVYVDRRV